LIYPSGGDIRQYGGKMAKAARKGVFDGLVNKTPALKQIYGRVPQELSDRFAKICADEGLSNNKGLEAAIKTFIAYYEAKTLGKR
jgi:hypothetical protein